MAILLYNTEPYHIHLIIVVDPGSGILLPVLDIFFVPGGNICYLVCISPHPKVLRARDAVVHGTVVAVWSPPAIDIGTAAMISSDMIRDGR